LEGRPINKEFKSIKKLTKRANIVRCIKECSRGDVKMENA